MGPHNGGRQRVMGHGDDDEIQPSGLGRSADFGGQLARFNLVVGAIADDCGVACRLDRRHIGGLDLGGRTRALSGHSD